MLRITEIHKSIETLKKERVQILLTPLQKRAKTFISDLRKIKSGIAKLATEKMSLIAKNRKK